MTFIIELPPQAETRLTAKARAAGMDVSSYAQCILQADASRPPLAEVLQPIRDAFNATGMTEDDLSDMLVKAKKEMRAERRK